MLCQGSLYILSEVLSMFERIFGFHTLHVPMTHTCSLHTTCAVHAMHDSCNYLQTPPGTAGTKPIPRSAFWGSASRATAHVRAAHPPPPSEAPRGRLPGRFHRAAQTPERSRPARPGPA